MKRFAIFCYTVIILSLCAHTGAFSQMHDYIFKLGVQGNGILPATEFWESQGIKGAYTSRGFLRFGLSAGLQMELGGGYGSYAGLDFNRDYYRTEMVIADIRFLASFVQSDDWNPYFYFGGGGLRYRVTNLPSSPSPKEVNKDGYTGYIPAGLGMEIAIWGHLIMELSAGANYAFTDDLNYYREGKPTDGWYSGGIGFTIAIGGGDSDDDGDSLMNKEEKEIGTDPENPDTDGDGLNDGDELRKYLTNPLKADTDGDQLNDGEEILKYQTNPFKRDTDGDGLDDNDEILKYKTDPLIADTDLDGINDEYEIFKYKTNPLAADSDGDGLKDGAEINEYRTDPLKDDTDGDGLKDGEEVNQYRTDPLKDDTDGDGLKDGEEVTLYKTDPLKPDTDGDTLGDGEEITQYKTDPLKIDTDGGSLSDDKEIKIGTNPLDAGDDVPKIQQELKVEVNVPIVLDGIIFKTGSAEITPASQEILMQAFNTLDRHPEIEVEIQGHTDNVGKRDYNMKLSQRRADAVRMWLLNKGVAPARVTAAGFGPDKPITPNTTAEDKQKNRRIEFLRTK